MNNINFEFIILRIYIYMDTYISINSDWNANIKIIK